MGVGGVGELVGTRVGEAVGDSVGGVGLLVGDAVGMGVGGVGELVGARVGEAVGDSVGGVGDFDGDRVGDIVGGPIRSREPRSSLPSRRTAAQPISSQSKSPPSATAMRLVFKESSTESQASPLLKERRHGS